MVLTYHAAEGLTFDTICLPRLVTASFSKWSDDTIRRLVFVRITRATSWVYLSGVSGSIVYALKVLLPLEETGKISVRRPTNPLFAAPDPEHGAVEGDSGAASFLDGLV